MGVRNGMLGDLGGLQHAIIALAIDNQIPYTVIPPKTLKKNVTGSGNAGKWEMFDALPVEIQEEFTKYYKMSKRTIKKPSGSAFDVADAYWLATQ